MKLKNKIAVITGAGKGIEKAIALSFAVEGAHVIVADIDENSARTTIGEIKSGGANAIYSVVDVSRQSDAVRLKEMVEREFGGLDILVNNAGIMGQRSFLFDADDTEWRKT